jgi:uncharacterized membrane protein
VKVSLKVVLTLVVCIIAMFVTNVIENADSEYNTGLFAIIIIFGCIAGIITIWSNKPENLEAKTSN